MRVLIWFSVLGLAAFSLVACGPSQEPTPAEPPPTPGAVSIGMGELLPQTLLGRDRQSLDVQQDSALGAGIETARARYGEIEVAVTDFGSAEMAEMMGHGWANAPGAEQIAGHPAQRDESAGRAATRIVIGRRVLVETTAASDAEASSAMEALDLSAFR